MQQCCRQTLRALSPNNSARHASHGALLAVLLELTLHAVGKQAYLTSLPVYQFTKVGPLAHPLNEPNAAHGVQHISTHAPLAQGAPP
jgi:hypothetical protein